MSSTATAARRGALVLCRSVTGQSIGVPVEAPRRQRLSTIVARHADRRRPFVVSVHRPGDPLRPEDHTVRLRRQWAKTYVGARHTVVITYLPLGGGGQGRSAGKQIGGAVAMIALMAAATVVAPGIGNAAVSALSGGLFTTASSGLVQGIAAGLVIGGSYAVSLATRSSANDASNSESRQLYGVSGGGNLPRPGDRIPVGYGTFWTKPDLTQPAFTVYDGDDQVLYQRMTLGLGSYQVERIDVGTATLWTRDGGVQSPFNSAPASSKTGATGSPGITAVEIIDPGETSTLVPSTVYTNPNVASITLPQPGDNPAWSGPWITCPPGETVTRIQISFEAPTLGDNRGQQRTATPVNPIWYYAPCDQDGNPTGSWVYLYNWSITAITSAAKRDTVILDVPEGRYVVRGQNLANKVDNVDNAIIWSALAGWIPGTITRPHVTEIALRIRSSKALGVTAFSEIYVKATRILPVWNGSAWVDTATRKAVWAWCDVLRSAYGGALDDSRVDATRAKYYADLLDENDTYDGVIRGPVSVWEAASVVLGPMRAEPAALGSVWSIVRDEAKTARKHVFTRRQIAAGSTASDFKVARDDGAADVIVEYAPDCDPRRKRDVRVTFGTESLTPRRVRVEGVSSYAHAHHIATWMAASAYYRRELRKFSTDRQGRIIGRGDPIRADSWFLSAGRAAGVLSASGSTLTLDTEVEVGASTYAILRDRRGREWGPCKITHPGAALEVIELDGDDVTAAQTATGQSLASVLAADDEDMTSVLCGELTELQDSWLVRSVQHSGRDQIAIEAVYDHPDVWTALGEEPPPEPTPPSTGGLVPPTVPTVAWVRARAATKGAGLAMDWSVRASGAIAAIVVMLSYDEGDTWEQVSASTDTTGTYPIRHVDGVAVEVIAYAVGTNGLVSATASTTFETFEETVAPGTLGEEIRDHIETRLAAFNTAVDKLLQIAASAATEAQASAWLDRKQLRNELRATTGSLGAAVSQVTTVATSATQALASLTTQVQAVAGDLSAAVTEFSVAIAGLDGKLAALWGVKTDVNGRVQSIKLFDDGTTAGVAFTVESFLIALGSDTPGDAVPAFAATLDELGNPTFEFNGEVRARSIDTEHIKINGVDFENILDGATSGVTVVAPTDLQTNIVNTDTSPGTGAYVGSQSVSEGSATMTLKKGVVSIDIDFVLETYFFNVSTGQPFIIIDLVIDGTTVKSYDYSSQHPTNATTISTHHIAYYATGLTADASHTVAFYARMPNNAVHVSLSSNGGYVKLSQKYIRLIELRK